MVAANTKPQTPKCVAVLDDDSASRNTIVAALTELGVESVVEFDSGSAGWKQIKTAKFDLIIMEWDLPKVSGKTMFNRLRTDESIEFTPVVVISGQLSKKDFSLMGDLPFTSLLEKPFTKAFLKRKLQGLIKESAWFEKERENLAELEKYLQADPGEAIKKFIPVLSNSPRPVPIGLSAARVLSKNRNFAEAEAILKHLLKSNPESLLIMTELGKIYLQTNNSDKALSILKRAQGLAPENVERLCMLGDVSLKKLDTDAAKKYFSAAKKVDKSSTKVKAGITLTKNVDNFLSQPETTSIPDSFAGMLNAIGVSMVRSENYDDGMEHYKSALEHVYDDDTKSRLAFNLGLGFMRWEKPSSALPWFNKSSEYSGGTFEKAERHVERTKKIIEKDGRLGKPKSKSTEIEGADVTLYSGDDSKEDLSEEKITAQDISRSSSEPMDTSFDPDGIDDFDLNFDQGVDLSMEEGDSAEMMAMLSGEKPEKTEAKEPETKAPKPKDSEFGKISAKKEKKASTSDVKTNKKSFLDAVPMGQELLNLLEEKNSHLGSNLVKLVELLNTHGNELLTEAVEMALDLGTPDANRVSFFIECIIEERDE